MDENLFGHDDKLSKILESVTNGTYNMKKYALLDSLLKKLAEKQDEGTWISSFVLIQQTSNLKTSNNL